MPNFNCTYEVDTSLKTLAQLRTDLMVRLGFAAQAANPPPGMTALLDSFLYDAQQQLFRRYPVLRAERFFRWTMTPGERYYGIKANDEQNDPVPVTVTLDAHSVTWVGVTDLNGVWYPLIEGIAPEAYTMVDAAPGWPTRYEIRDCIEVWPAPDEAYTLRVKGRFMPTAFAANDDRPTVDQHALFLLALGQAKKHYGQADGGDYLAQAGSYIGSLVGGSHHTARYVPGTRPREAMTPPRMTEFDA